MNALDLLSSLLTQATNAVPVCLRQNSDIDGQLAELMKNSKTGGRAFEPIDLQVEAVTRFRESPQFESLRDARLVSFGLGIVVPGASNCLMEDRRLFHAALSGVDEWGEEPRQFRKCYQGLMRSYFGYDGFRKDIPDDGRENWTTLRTYLSRHAAQIVDKELNPDWVLCARENAGLMSATPCAGSAKELAEGRHAQVEHMRSLLGIDDASWFTRELILAQVLHAAQLPNDQFVATVTGLLHLLGDNKVLRNRGLQLILNRYALIPQTPQHQGLKERAVTAWGNPWLPSSKEAWGGVDEAAKAMVSDWLKLEFIELFFSKLAQDGIGDTRRVNFWRKYVQSIQGIHFALGSNAMYSQEQDFRELRAKLKGLLVRLEEPNGANNAFIMTMGDLVAVEFSGATNAFYGYSVKRELPFDLSQPVCTPVDGRNSLKNSSRVLYLRHQDNVQGMDWEERFAHELQWRFHIEPGKAAPASATTAPTKPPTPPAPPVTPPPSERWTPPPRGPWVPPAQPATQPPAVARPAPPATVAPAVAPTQTQRRPTQMPPGTPRNITGSNGNTSGLEGILRSKVPEAKAQPMDGLPFSRADLNSLARRMGATVADHLGTGGALWVLIEGPTSADARQQLSAWGFNPKDRKGWWVKPKP
jgi:hypothetical protein